MKKRENKSQETIQLLSRGEMACTRGGGSIVNHLLKFAAWGVGYFFQMGLQEGRKTRAALQ